MTKRNNMRNKMVLDRTGASDLVPRNETNPATDRTADATPSIFGRAAEHNTGWALWRCSSRAARRRQSPIGMDLLLEVRRAEGYRARRRGACTLRCERPSREHQPDTHPRPGARLQ